MTAVLKITANFSRRFDNPDLNFQKVFYSAKAQVTFRNNNSRQNCLKLYFSTLQVQKRQSATAKSHLIPQNVSLNLLLSTCQHKNCKKIIDAVALMDDLRIEQTHFFSISGRL